jgi:hypothetical protein
MKLAYLDREQRVRGRVSNVARESDVDAESEHGSVESYDDRNSASLGSGDSVLELSYVLTQIEGVPGRVRM